MYELNAECDEVAVEDGATPSLENSYFKSDEFKTALNDATKSLEDHAKKMFKSFGWKSYEDGKSFDELSKTLEPEAKLDNFEKNGQCYRRCDACCGQNKAKSYTGDKMKTLKSFGRKKEGREYSCKSGKSGVLAFKKKEMDDVLADAATTFLDLIPVELGRQLTPQVAATEKT